MICQPGDEARIVDQGFTQVTPLGKTGSWQGLSLQRTPGHHGLGTVEQQMGAVSGFVLRAPGEPTLYWAGDTVWCPEVLAVASAAHQLIPGRGPALVGHRGLAALDMHEMGFRLRLVANVSVAFGES